MPKLEFTENYSSAMQAFRDTWIRVMPWMIVWLLAFILPVQTYVSRKQMFYFDIDSGNFLSGTISYYAIGILLCVFVSAFALYSMFGVVYRTDEDNYANWLTCGVQGIAHPLKAFGCAFLFQVVSIACWFGFDFILGFFRNAGMLSSILGALFVIIWFCIAVNFIMTWYKSMDDPDLSLVCVIKDSTTAIHGERKKTILLMLPALLLTWVCANGAISCYGHYSESDRIEAEFAEETLKHAKETAAKDQDFVDKLNNSAYNRHDLRGNDFILSHEVYQEDMPEYDGNFEVYIHEMAEYGYQREVFEARRDMREISVLAQEYYHRPPKIKIWMAGAFFCGLAGTVALAFALVLLLNIYRGFEKEDRVIKASPKEKPKPQLVMSNAKHDEEKKEPSGLIQNNVPIDKSETVDKSPELSSDLLTALRFGESAKTPEVSAPEPEQTPEPESESESELEQMPHTDSSKFAFPSALKVIKAVEKIAVNDAVTADNPVVNIEEPQAEKEVMSAMSEASLAEKKSEIRAWREKLVAGNKKALKSPNVPVLSGQNTYYPTANSMYDDEYQAPFQNTVHEEEVYQNRNPIDYSDRLFDNSEPQLRPILLDNDDNTPFPRQLTSGRRLGENDYQRKKTVSFDDFNLG